MRRMACTGQPQLASDRLLLRQSLQQRCPSCGGVAFASDSGTNPFWHADQGSRDLGQHSFHCIQLTSHQSIAAFASVSPGRRSGSNRQHAAAAACLTMPAAGVPPLCTACHGGAAAARAGLQAGRPAGVRIKDAAGCWHAASSHADGSRCSRRQSRAGACAALRSAAGRRSRGGGPPVAQRWSAAAVISCLL